ncbi:hypothetical protein O181_074997 [Austropuccinia psidii MF-1]|uniref:Reverse transcriptase/retrotransposon-derived protein RNase H-like domain-containing protein n=1 Tax=Austropuccinia psidii MF-1 TaxID=1389203 RepID=A0A9Q3FBW9_9BASI|nr:hypothetical protein [Austropuccinia psidii MF-1]
MDSPFFLKEEILSQFQIPKEAFKTAPIVSHYNPFLTSIVESDACDYSLDAVLSQVDDLGRHLIAFAYKKRLPAELKYQIPEKELLGIV